MGSLVDGRWQTGEVGKAGAGGHFQRKDSAFRNWVTADGAAGPDGRAGFAAEPDRYHLYVSYACPWAHRALIMRALKGLESLIGVSVVHWKLSDQGWTFEAVDGATGDPVLGCEFLHGVYTRSAPDFTGSVTVPVLWDMRGSVIVNNESADIIRMFNGAFDGVGARGGDYYPAPLRAQIDEVNERVYDTVNNGVYKAGFAKSQAAYEKSVRPLFESLEWLEDRLAKSRFLVGDQLTEADIRLFTTLVRFDPVYHGHFKCNLKRIVDYPALWRFTCELMSMPEIGATVNTRHIKHHYYESHPSINPSGIVPVGPLLVYGSPPASG
jgi:putative glutathione S-transferase